ncbi:hypothetical protein HNP38_002044 [Chryseobacterium defluvii]|uniref:Lipoprotein n=1 Tax=Chryseobacterium defluvii TaxID=160396 RepID=A0A840KFE7_9FLAO|nr:hypothetical protein [Chryseobacterium defluvii]MBB4806748.1 hypothetical protein [Chryseobacterium defluvii]
MKQILKIITLFALSGFLSCNNKTENTRAKKVHTDKASTAIIPDSIEKLIVDDYPVTNEMFINKGNDLSYTRKSGQTFSHDKVWFSNDILRQTIVVELYTDYHRLHTFHFYNNAVPNDLISKMWLSAYGEPASEKQKQKDFNGFLKQAAKISSSYFVTNKGFKLGDPKQKAVSYYGKPDKQTIDEGTEKLEWNFIGDNSYDINTGPKSKPLAKDSFGHQIIMYFKNEKLVGQILSNDIP